MDHTILYLECSSGISGDMTVAALLDLGADRQVLSDALVSLPLDGYSIEISEVFKSGIRACDFNVILEQDNHDHDMAYLHGGEPQNHTVPDGCEGHSHAHGEHEEHTHTQAEHGEHAHTHAGHGEHTHAEHEGHTHTHAARNLDDVLEIIQAGRMTEAAKALASHIFQILARAEAAVHGKPIQEVHFHEVGAVDSIVDIVAAAVCLDNLHPDEVVFSALTDGTGQIRCQHGLIPVPVPATAAIAEQNGLILKLSDISGELVTPTGAAIAAAAGTSSALPEEFRIKRTGFGAGKRNYAATGLLRAMLLQPLIRDHSDTVLTLETNIDDCTGEALSFTMQQLLEAGALDAFYIPIYMKKNRPAYLLKTICEPEMRTELESIIFRNTTTIGIRVQTLERTKLARRILALETPWGMADVKCCTHGSETYYYPENDSVCQLARLHGIGFPDMYQMLSEYARAHA